MSDFSPNTPIMPSQSKPGPAGWVSVWIKALTKPNELTFAEIIAGPDTTSKTAFIWIFIAGTVSGFIQAISRTIATAAGIQQQIPIPGLEQYMPQVTGGADAKTIATTLFGGICSAPIAGLLSIAFFALFVAIIQWVAKLFGGTGSFEKLAYALAAISVPVSLITSVLTFFSIIPYVGVCAGLISLLFGLYALYLQITATKAVNQFGWGQAAGSVLIPFAVILFFCCCVIFGLSAVFGAAFSQLNKNFAP